MEPRVLPSVPAPAAPQVSLTAVPTPPPRKTRRQRLREELLNAPNLMTLARIALIPVFLWLLAYENRHNSFLAALVFSVAAITD